MRRVLFALMLSLALPPGLRAAAEPSPLWIVVIAPAFRDALEPLCEQRKKQGFQVKIVQTTDILSVREIAANDGNKLRDHVRKLCSEYKAQSYVLLVGAIEPGTLKDPINLVVPALKGTTGRMKDQPSDNAYGCDGTALLPVTAVGRFPARSEAEARGMVHKTLDYERADQPGLWRRRLTVLGGIPAYNAFVDRMVESLAMVRFERLDPIWSGLAIYHNENSRFCVPDSLLHEYALQNVGSGQAFTFYFGHSNATGFYAGNARYLLREDWERLKIAQGRGILATFGCNGCQLKGFSGEGYGVAAMRNPNGPTAVLGSHGICFAAMVQLAADGLVESTFTKGMPDRLGDSWLACEKGLAEGKIDDVTFGLLDAVDGDSTIPQATQRLEHLEMFTLLGDPALKLPAMPADIELKSEGKVEPRAAFVVTGTAPKRLEGAKVHVTIERALASVPTDLEKLPKAAGPERDKAMAANYQKANQFVLIAADATIKDGQFMAKLTLPDKLPSGKLLLRAYASNDKDDAMRVRTLKP